MRGIRIGPWVIGIHTFTICGGVCVQDQELNYVFPILKVS